MPSQPEEWRPVVGHEGSYEVSSLGRVRSLDRTIVTKAGVRKRARGRLLALPINHARGGYPQVTLSTGTRTVHTLVAAAFIGPRPAGMETCHQNGNPADNRVDNLRYATPSDNNYDAVRHGTHWPSRLDVCPNGHPYTPENTGTQSGKNGKTARRCMTCWRRNSKEAGRRWRERRAAETLTLP